MKKSPQYRDRINLMQYTNQHHKYSDVFPNLDWYE